MTKENQMPPDHLPSDVPKFAERRTAKSDRRKAEDRRSSSERRFDSRQETVKRHKPIAILIRALFHSRLGVDRRKNIDRRMARDRRLQLLRSVLTQEEINDLLSV